MRSSVVNVENFDTWRLSVPSWRRKDILVTRKKGLMVTWDDSSDKQANIYRMEDRDEKIELKTCFEFDTSYSSSTDDEEDIPYDVLILNHHMTLLQRKKYKENYKAFVF